MQKDNDCKLKHIMNWLSLIVDMHNREIMEKCVKHIAICEQFTQIQDRR